MILRQNKSRGYKLRMSVKCDKNDMAQIIELGLGTKDYREAAARALLVVDALLLTNRTTKNRIYISGTNPKKYISHEDVAELKRELRRKK